MNKKWFWLIGIGCALVLFILADLCSKQNWFGEFSIKYQVRKLQLKRKVRLAVDNHKAQNTELWRDFEKDLAKVGHNGFEQAYRNVPGVVKKFSSFKWCGKLCYKMAKDKLYLTHDTQQAMVAVLGPAIIRPCEHGHAEIMETVMIFQHKLMENDNQFRAELAQITAQNPYFSGNFSAHQKFMVDTAKIAGQIESNSIFCMSVAVGTAWEAICIRGTMAGITKLCGHIAAKLTASGGSAAVCAIADGPLPIGDVICGVIVVGGLSWCAYDIYRLTGIMPREMRKSLNNSIVQYQKSSREEALAIGRKFFEQYQKSSDDILNSF